MVIIRRYKEPIPSYRDAFKENECMSVSVMHEM